MANTPHDGARSHPGIRRTERVSIAETVPVPTAELRCAFSGRVDVTRALATSCPQAQAAEERVRTLTEINARLNQELIELAKREAQVRDFAYRDELTALPNRRLLLDRLKQAVAQAARQKKQVVLLLLDLDGFKGVNDRLGHGGGDKLLRVVARRLAEGIRGADTACRYGGDEFMIMLPDVDNPDVAAAVRGKLELALAAPYIVDGYRVRLTASVGGVVYPTDGLTPEELIRRADSALYRNKARSTSAVIERLPRKKRIEADDPQPATTQPG